MLMWKRGDVSVCGCGSAIFILFCFFFTLFECLDVIFVCGYLVGELMKKLQSQNIFQFSSVHRQSFGWSELST